MTDCDYHLQRIVITLDIPDEPGSHITAIGALLDVLDHFQREGLQAHWVTLEISGPATTP